MRNNSTNPNLTDVIDASIEDFLRAFNSHRIGIIDAFNPSNQTATIRLVDKGIVLSGEEEEVIDLALLTDCPVVINKGTNGGLTIPIIPGDTCLVLFNDRDIDNWFEDGLIQKSNTLRVHDFSDAIALVGIRNSVNKIADYNNNATELNFLNNKFSIDATKMSAVHSSGGSVAIDDKLELKNTAENLKDIIDELITIVTNLKVVGEIPITAATAAALAALSPRVGDLLK